MIAVETRRLRGLLIAAEQCHAEEVVKTKSRRSTNDWAVLDSQCDGSSGLRVP